MKQILYILLGIMLLSIVSCYDDEGNYDYHDINEVTFGEINTMYNVLLNIDTLKIDVGDFVCFDPRTRITEHGYFKSRFLDDKLSVGILLGFAKYLQEENICQERAIYVHITVYEEVGHGGSASVPEGVTEAVSVDMGCVGEGLQCREHQVSICAKDSGGPYDYGVVTGLIEAAKATGADYVVDVYPHYGSDVEATLRAGYDIRHGLIGAGVYASHGYERSHRNGVASTWKVLIGYCGQAEEE